MISPACQCGWATGNIQNHVIVSFAPESSSQFVESHTKDVGTHSDTKRFLPTEKRSWSAVAKVDYEREQLSGLVFSLDEKEQMD